MRILFCGNYAEGEIVLERLIKEYAVTLIATRKNETYNNGILNLAKSNRIRVLDEKYLNYLEVKKALPEGIDLIVVNNCKKILEMNLIHLANRGGINLHSSLLPKYRGRAPINWALINNEKKTGITIHYIDKGIDTGNIILQKEISIKDSDDYTTLLKRNIDLEPDLFVQAIKLVADGYKGIKQKRNNAVWPYLSSNYRHVNWHAHSRTIFNLIRALVRPFPGALTLFKNQKLSIFKGREFRFSEKIKKYRKGQIISIGKNTMEIFTQPKTLLIEELETSGQKTIVKLIKSNFFQKGDIFENFS